MADLGTDNYETRIHAWSDRGRAGAIFKEIDEALERIINKTYGVCLATGNPIGKARLKATAVGKVLLRIHARPGTGQERGAVAP